jgi:predicted Zn-dependent protease
LGESLWEDIQSTHPPIHDDAAEVALDRLLYRLCVNNGIDTAGLQRHLVQNPEVNAFALPGRRLVIQSGLIHNAMGADEVAGVLAHELAHVQKGHVRHKTFKEAGLSLLISWISFGTGMENTQLQELALVLSSTAFDRKYESEADRVAVLYLQKAGIHPEGLANFMDRLASTEKTNPAPPEWFSTHPASPKRAAQIRQLEHDSNLQSAYTTSLAASDWKALKQACKP